MARRYGNSTIGKVGDKIYYTWCGRECVRSMPTTVANPRTEAQQAHRQAFGLVAKLSSQMKEAHAVGLHAAAVKEKNTTHAIFKRLNKDCVGADGAIDYGRVVVSRGTVPKVEVTAVGVEGGVLGIAFEAPFGGAASDELFLYVHCPAYSVGHLTEPVRRSAGGVSVELPPEWVGKRLELYLFLRGSRLRTSNSQHVALGD